MELKRIPDLGIAWISAHLLIVPYGIETREQPDVYKRSDLLIVPYGIETMLFRIWLRCVAVF